MIYKYANGDGNDIIYNYNSKDNILITSGTYSKSTIENDVLIKVGKGTTTLVGAKGRTINVMYYKHFL